MPLPSGAPAWAAEVALAYESGAHSQFVLSGNVTDRLVSGNRLQPLQDWILAHLLPAFGVVFTYDLGNGLRIERGREIADQWSALRELTTAVKQPRAALEIVTGYLRYLDNLRRLGQEGLPHVACIIRGADQVFPADGGQDVAGLVSLVRDWSAQAPYIDLPFVSLLVADFLVELHPLLGRNPNAARIAVPLPDAAALASGLTVLQRDRPAAFAPDTDLARLSEALQGVSLSSVESTIHRRAHQGTPISDTDLLTLKKSLVEGEAANLLEFIESKRTLDDYHGQPALKTWLRQDADLWRKGDLAAMPMGYLICGPVGTGKTYLVECIAGDAGVPVVKLKNFRDKWVGSSEANLETIFRLVHALGRCMVFVDEADQTLGKRDASSNDGGLSGRLYAMIAQEMSDTRNRGRILWILASSRPDLIEVDLKRPGRVDVKVPILPTATPAESLALLRVLAKRRGLALSDEEAARLLPIVPIMLTPGAAETLVVKAYRSARTRNLGPEEALRDCLDGWQQPVPADVMDFQMRIAIRESSDRDFVPEPFRHLVEAP